MSRQPISHWMGETYSVFPSLNNRKRAIVTLALGVTSALLTLAGLFLLLAFDSTPGEVAGPPARWPGRSVLKHPENRPALLVFVHPQCVCTSATFAELAQIGLLSSSVAAPDVMIAAFRPGSNSAWRIDSLTARVSGIPGARVIWDDGAIEARRFGAKTSGDVLLYSARGALLFEGGVTASRGHEGDNYGLTRLLQVLRARAPQGAAVHGGPVFGCSLASPRGKVSNPVSLTMMPFLELLKARILRLARTVWPRPAAGGDFPNQSVWLVPARAPVWHV